MFAFQVKEEKKIRVICDSDTACEADDPFALTHALLSPKLIVKVITVEHFKLPGSMELSWQAARRVTDALGSEVPVLKGEIGPGQTGDISEGVQAIIAEARRDDPRPLFLLCMGALTNIARAFKEAPDIQEHVTVVTIGGNEYGEPVTWPEYNFGNDPDAANTVLSSRAEIWQIPNNAYGSIRIGLAELQTKVRPFGAIGRYLFDQMIAYNDLPSTTWTPGESWSLGDSPSVAVTLDPQCGRYSMRQALRIKPDTSYGEAVRDKVIRVYESIDSRYLLEDFFAKLQLKQMQ